jgi:hypothetical protein
LATSTGSFGPSTGNIIDPTTKAPDTRAAPESTPKKNLPFTAASAFLF